MIDNRSLRWRAESHAPTHDASPKIAGQARMGRTRGHTQCIQRLVRGRRRGSTRREMRGNEDWQRGLFCSNQLKDDGRKNIMQQSIRKMWVERRCETRDIDEGKEVQTDQLVDNMGQGQKQGQDNPLRGMKKMMRDDKIDDGWRVTTRDKGWTKRSTLCETKMRTIMREKNVDN